MQQKEILDALRNLEDVALAFTVKTSTAETPAQFLEDYLANKKAFEDIKAQNKQPWVI